MLINKLLANIHDRDNCLGYNELNISAPKVMSSNPDRDVWFTSAFILRPLGNHCLRYRVPGLNSAQRGKIAALSRLMQCMWGPEVRLESANAVCVCVYLCVTLVLESASTINGHCFPSGTNIQLVRCIHSSPLLILECPNTDYSIYILVCFSFSSWRLFKSNWTV